MKRSYLLAATVAASMIATPAFAAGRPGAGAGARMRAAITPEVRVLLQDVRETQASPASVQEVVQEVRSQVVEARANVADVRADVASTRVEVVAAVEAVRAAVVQAVVVREIVRNIRQAAGD